MTGELLKTLTADTFDEVVLGSDIPGLVDFWARLRRRTAP